ncbi:putative Actin-binding, cofilin/tropomyosin type protein [Pseudoloma neurophilia]|uniref:Putative Actin-binding, cofilin/tropomyosin type protein n=1 Tax=Pseudoloma neurophilia TaxID=146866 RepID=A0A0R0LZG0_9MICR|nr:putative Actin-binding, cofilin/tropomyosin type protein [Pseudoloma neurophilia]
MSNLLKNSSKLEQSLGNVVRRKSSFLIFDVPNIINGDFAKLYESEPIEIDGNARIGIDMPTIENSRKKFNECLEEIAKHDACYILYDFYFENESGDIRNILILICYLDDQKCPINKKFFYSSNVINIKDEVNAAEHITVHSLNELSFEEIQDKCRRIKKN